MWEVERGMIPHKKISRKCRIKCFHRGFRFFNETFKDKARRICFLRLVIHFWYQSGTSQIQLYSDKVSLNEKLLFSFFQDESSPVLPQNTLYVQSSAFLKLQKYVANNSTPKINLYIYIYRFIECVKIDSREFKFVTKEIANLTKVRKMEEAKDFPI